MEPIAHGTRRSIETCCWPGCYQDQTDLPLCEDHRRQVGYAWVGDNIDLVRAVCGTVPSEEVLFDRVRRDADANAPVRDARLAAAREERQRGAVVYYLRLPGDRVKIGYTTDLRRRLAELRLYPDDILATEPGGRDVEQTRHQQFADERYGRREDFAASDRLRTHIVRVRAAQSSPVRVHPA